ncbi:MAG TPA: hypothetical protein VG347_09000 [Verrucomicrobiae bacterium]|nr:hypothetical protein [Verrucomicrobiae bacterium]
MARIKKSVIALLPVFWLVTLSYAPFESTAAAAALQHATASIAVDATAAAPESADLCYFPNDQIRHVLRRHLLDRGEESQFTSGLLTAVRTSSSPVALTAIPLPGEFFSLQQRWQFLWRTAAPPRAPTFLA